MKRYLDYMWLWGVVITMFALALWLQVAASRNAIVFGIGIAIGLIVCKVSVLAAHKARRGFARSLNGILVLVTILGGLPGLRDAFPNALGAIAGIWCGVTIAAYVIGRRRGSPLTFDELTGRKQT